MTSFPVDDITLDLLDHALNAKRADDGTITGADMTVSQLLEFLSPAMDEEEIARRTELADIMCTDVVDISDLGWIYHRDDVIRALVAEVRRLRTRPDSGVGG